MMLPMLWVCTGILVGGISGITIVRTVFRVQPELSRRALMFIVVRGLLLRLCLAASAIALGLRQGLAPALLVFGGLWLGRWFTVYLGTSNRIAWA